MTIASPNGNPRSIPYIAALLRDAGEKFVIVDVGARGGLNPLWAPLKTVSDFIGFETDPAECVRLDQKFPGTKHYPVALHDHDGADRYCVTRSPYCHGHFGAVASFLGRFPNYPACEVMEERTVQYSTFDQFAESQGIARADFIKIDTEGSELQVLKGAEASLRSRRIVGIQSEFWWDGHIKGQPSFAELDVFLRERGYFFFDIECQRYPRRPLPVGPIQATGQNGGAWKLNAPPLFKDHGQILTGDALYFRDPLVDLGGHSPNPFPWDDGSILRLIGLLDLFNYQDFALEIATFYRSRFVLPVDVDALMDLLVPVLELPTGQTVTVPFDQYYQWSAQLFNNPPLENDTMPEYTPVGQRKR